MLLRDMPEQNSRHFDVAMKTLSLFPAALSHLHITLTCRNDGNDPWTSKDIDWSQLRFACHKLGGLKSISLTNDMGPINTEGRGRILAEMH